MRSHRYGKASGSRLLQLRPEMVQVAETGLLHSPYDITIIHTFRGEELQNALYRSGASKSPWPTSDHNTTVDGLPMSDAFDFGPWVMGDIPWKETHIFAAIAGVFMAGGLQMGYRLEWGGDWDGDGLSSDQTLLDWGHIAYKGRLE